MAENVALHTLAEDESLARYRRKRLSQSFEKRLAPKKPKSHSPSCANILVDKENVLHELREFPQNTKINLLDLTALPTRMVVRLLSN